MVRKSILMGTSMLVASTFVGTASAQQDEIVITATKREQTLQEVPVAVTVTDAETIEKARILDILDIQSVVPSLRVSQLQNSAQTNFIIRGFGNGANNAGIEPSVGVFIDGVYRSRSAAQISDLPNLERVEVLRGPQSTLFGKNASAGVISVVTKKASFEREGFLEATVGNYDAFQAKGYFTGPLSDRLAYSLGGTYNKRDGYAENIVTGNDINDRDRYSLRGELLFEATDNATFRLIGDYDEIDEVCCDIGNLVFGPTGGALTLLNGGQPPVSVEDPFSYDATVNFEPTNEIENSGVSFQGDIDLNDNLTLTSITAFRNSSVVRDGDVDFTAVDVLGSNAQSVDIDTFTQELRIASNFDGRVNFLAGLYYFDETVDQTDSIVAGTQFRSYIDLLTGAPGTLAGIEAALGLQNNTLQIAGNGAFESSTQDNEAYSIFGQVDFEISDRLTATLGISYVNDQKDVSLSQVNTLAFSQIDFVQLGFGSALAGAGLDPTDPTIFADPANLPIIQAAAIGATDPAQNPLLGLQALQFTPQLLGFPNAGFDGTSDDSNVDYTVRLAYDLTDNINVYGSYATGYKASSFNLSRDSRPTSAELDGVFGTVDQNLGNIFQIGGVATGDIFGRQLRNGQPANLVAGTRLAGPEEAEVFEIGLKGRFDWGTLNVAVFDQTIEDFQGNIFTGAAFTLANAGESKTTGVEVDASWFVTDNWTLGFAGTFIDPTYEDFTSGPLGDISGTQRGGVHEESIVVSSNWNWERGPYTGFVRADYQYESEVDIQDGGDLSDLNLATGANGFRTREVNLVNASVGISRDQWDVSVFGRNLFNDEYLITNFPSVVQPGSFSGYANQPRTYGVTLRRSF